MTDNNHPITPPHDLVEKWSIESPIQHSDETWAYELFIADQAARWGADQELEACRLWASEESIYAARELVEARRPKPPRLKEQALQALALLKVDASTHGLSFDSSAIRRALESLPD